MIEKYGIFWLPEKNVVNFINGWKSRVRLLEPDAIYLEHPVHSTIYLLMADNTDEHKLIAAIEKACSDFSVFSIMFSGWHVFRADAATGGNTLVMSIKPCPELFNLQRTIASGLSFFRQGEISYNIPWQGEYAASMKLWGFPFVGSHWVPHVSVASVKNTGRVVIDEAMNSKELLINGIVDRLALYIIEGDKHTCIATFTIGGVNAR